MEMNPGTLLTKTGTQMLGRILMGLIGQQETGSTTCLRTGMTHGKTGTGEALKSNGHGTTALRWLAIRRQLLEP